MDESKIPPVQPNPPKRRKKSKLQIFKETQLPFLIAGVALILIVIFIVGSINLRKDRQEAEDDAKTASELLQAESDTLERDAKVLAAQYDYQGAMEILGGYTGGLSANPTLKTLYDEYAAAWEKAVVWNDLSQIPNLSFRSLMPDLERALADERYGERFGKNYITTTEFSSLLQQLYDGGYVLVSLYDVVPTVTGADGALTFGDGAIRLPAGKKPILLTQEAANFFTYMVDGDGDGLADKDGAGFASKLVLDANGALKAEMVSAGGETLTGDYDLIPILESFVAAHPDFSYQGARATIALCGYDGLFGYRTDPETAEKISRDYYEQQLDQVKPIIAAVKAAGYDLACSSYGFDEYSELGSAAVKDDLALWEREVKPLLGDVDILVYPNDGDIKGTDTYEGTKYEILSGAGLRYFIGRSTDGSAWVQKTDSYVRQNRLWVTAQALTEHADWFAALFDAGQVLEGGRSQ